MTAGGWPDGPIVLGVGWRFSERLVRTAADLADALGRHLVCAFVDPASYLTEWEPDGTRTARSLDPTVNEEADFPSGQMLLSLEILLGQPGERWSFRVLNGEVSQALARLAESTGASLLVVGAERPGALAWMDRLLEGSVSASLLSRQEWPVLIVAGGG
ncbi:universal stress protein [Pseudarthrobacter sp. H2]|uniref:universal stress protein n=1 Tax=Pseudarthrobacter sp. H2 TaxID=3418415 RepID=UPI003CF4F47F